MCAMCVSVYILFLRLFFLFNFGSACVCSSSSNEFLYRTLSRNMMHVRVRRCLVCRDVVSTCRRVVCESYAGVSVCVFYARHSDACIYIERKQIYECFRRQNIGNMQMQKRKTISLCWSKYLLWTWFAGVWYSPSHTQTHTQISYCSASIRYAISHAACESSISRKRRATNTHTVDGQFSNAVSDENPICTKIDWTVFNDLLQYELMTHVKWLNNICINFKWLFSGLNLSSIPSPLTRSPARWYRRYFLAVPSVCVRAGFCVQCTPKHTHCADGSFARHYVNVMFNHLKCIFRVMFNKKCDFNLLCQILVSFHFAGWWLVGTRGMAK